MSPEREKAYLDFFEKAFNAVEDKATKIERLEKNVYVAGTYGYTVYERNPDSKEDYKFVTFLSSIGFKFYKERCQLIWITHEKDGQIIEIPDLGLDHPLGSYSSIRSKIKKLEYALKEGYLESVAI